MSAKCFTGKALFGEGRQVHSGKKVASDDSATTCKGEAVNLSIVTLSAILALGLNIAPNLAMQDESSESQPVDQVKVTKVTGTVQKWSLTSGG